MCSDYRLLNIILPGLHLVCHVLAADGLLCAAG